MIISRKEPMNATQASFFSNPEPEPSVNLTSCTLIYQPKGRAREYSPLACNVYKGCSHGCTYCFAPNATRRSREEFNAPATRGPSFLSKLEKEAARYQAAGITSRVLMCFTCDPYQPLDVTEQVTRHTIQTLHRHGLPIQILTKGGSRALRDLDLFGRGDAFAATLTFLDDAKSREWEPKAALPQDRINTLKVFHAAGIPTWVSLEPVISPVQSLSIIHRTHEFVDLFKVGTLNYHPVARTIDWRVFAHRVVELLISLGFAEIQADDLVLPGQRAFYVKADLKRYLS